MNRFSLGVAPWLSVVGALLSVLGACLEWDRRAPIWAAGAFVTAPTPVSAFGLMVGRLSVGWLISAAAVAALAFTALRPYGVSVLDRRARLLSGGLVLALAVLHAAPAVGVIVTALGGVLVLLGAAPGRGGCR